VRRVLDTWGHIDILVNNAALLGGRGVLDESTESFTRAVLVAALGNFLNTKHVARSMCERGIRGSIVCISSSNGWSGSPGVIAYAFHKGGVNNFARAAAMDLAPYGIRVNTFTPTMVTPDNPELIAAASPRRGPIGGAGGDEPWRRPARWTGERAPMVPMGMTGTPTDIGHCLAWICSDYARLITGCDFVVDGGARARNFAHIPAAAADLMGPAPVIPLDVTSQPD
jgi:NAD(P)-dependent dehydrogenase (short-subunit alcohol dehydrogenase family)